MSNESQMTNAYRPELPDWGVFLRWPQDGNDWIHEDDVALAESLIPSPRVFQRTRWDDPFYWLQYGEITLRVHPVMWVHVPPVDLFVGQKVELRAQLGKFEPGIFLIADILYDPAKSQVEYRLDRDGLVLETHFLRKDLRPVHVKHHLRAGYYQYEPPKSEMPADIETLDVGDLLGGEPEA